MFTLGVAFEQGKMLPTPETVPFRLTRDLVDGMGISGVEGVFRRCCEKTMEVMRTSQEALLTIVQVSDFDLKLFVEIFLVDQKRQYRYQWNELPLEKCYTHKFLLNCLL